MTVHLSGISSVNSFHFRAQLRVNATLNEHFVNLYYLYFKYMNGQKKNTMRKSSSSDESVWMHVILIFRLMNLLHYTKDEELLNVIQQSL